MRQGSGFRVSGSGLASRLGAALLAMVSLALSGAAQAPVQQIVELDADRKPSIITKGDCFIRGGTILTVANGVIHDGGILIRGGKIAAIGKDVPAPAGVPIIEAVGKFITPGIIDAHSHIAADEINEGTDAITAEVREHDVLDPQSLSLYRKLASGFTASLVLHGSANPIGGQSVVIKHKWKRPADELPVPDAPRIVKFALGENVKWINPFPGQGSRFPTTRMGVEAVYRRAFAEARRYMAERQTPNAERRTDLRLEALSDIIRGNIWVHCHCYRQDEMLMMLRLAKEFGFHLTLQHALEAYKIAPEIAAAGVGVSTFADAWGYKVEAYDAIPHNAALCTRAGIVTSVNTDTSDNMTLLNLDAAKAMKYGGLSEYEALRLITINPAIQLGIDRRAGSLEVGKDGDIAIWDGHPLSAYSRCAMTLVEGTVYFQRRDAFGLDKQATIQAALKPVTYIPGPERNATPPTADTVYAIVGGDVHPMSGPDIPGGTVVLGRGKISAIGKNVPIPKGASVINARGLHIYPGLIDAGSILGLSEIQQVPATIDTSERGGFQPDILAFTAVHPASEHFAVARCEGITTALVRPAGDPFGGSPMIAGQSGIVNLAGWTQPEMKVEGSWALHVSYPQGLEALPEWVRKFLPPDDLEKRRKETKEQVLKFREYFERAKRYAATRAQASDSTPADARLEAMIPFVTGKRPVVFHGGKPATIKKEIELAEQLGLKIVLAEVPQAWKLADMLAKKQIPVICTLSVVDGIEGEFPGEPYDATDSLFAMPALLHRAGVKFCFESGSAAMAKNLKFCGSVASAFGLPREAALKALTTDSAEILGIADRFGSLVSGKVANVIVTDGDPLEVTTSLRHLFINGRSVPLESRHTRLYEQYKRRPR